MIKNLKMDRPRIDPRNVRDRSTSRFGNQVALVRQPPKPVIRQPSKIVEPNLPAASVPEILHKEVFNNNMATVEVTVRATPPHMPAHKNMSLSDKCETWKKAPIECNGGEDYSFGIFDPLRTLHFLSKELQLKLQLLCPDDPNLHQIINDMQHAMQRLPPDVISRFQESILNDSSGDTKLLNLKDNINQTVQTLISTDNRNMSQENLEKLEADIKSKDNIIAELRKEKMEVNNELVIEKETREKLEKEIEFIKIENTKWQVQVSDLEKQVNCQNISTTQDLKILIEDLRTKYITMQKENIDIRNELAQVTLNKDKLNMLLECKEKQLEELRTELKNIQSFICAQVNRYRSKTNLSPSSSISSISKIWNTPTSMSSRCKSKDEFYLNSATVSHAMLKCSNTRAVGSETSTTFTETSLKKRASVLNKQNKRVAKDHVISSNTTITTHYKIKDKYSSMRAVFSEIKRQACGDSNITLSSCQPFNDLASLYSQQ